MRLPRKLTTKLALGATAVAVLAFAAFLLWFYLIKADPAPKFSTATLDSAMSNTSVATADPPAQTTAPAPATADPPATQAATPTTAAAAQLDGGWNATSASQLGYRVKEVLAGLDTEGVGRTNQITGSFTLEGARVTAAEFTVDMASIKSDEDRRDGQFRGRIMDVATYPTATFTLTAPIDFGSVPAEGAEISAKATGDLTLRGVTHSVTFDVTAKLQAGKIGVLGNIPVVFADYEIPNPSNGFATTGDNGLLEFVLVFEHA